MRGWRAHSRERAQPSSRRSAPHSRSPDRYDPDIIMSSRQIADRQVLDPRARTLNDPHFAKKVKKEA